jgi:hypothetical protein
MQAADYYVSPSGSGNCSYASPCSLSTAFGPGSPASGGDTVWLRGGTYTGSYRAEKSGSSTSNMLTYRNFPGERPIIDQGYVASRANYVLSVKCSYCRFWGIELTNSQTSRLSPDMNGTDIHFGEGFVIYDDGVSRFEHVELLNSHIYQTAQGVSWWAGCKNCLLEGDWLAYNGWTAQTRGMGHAVYTQNLNDPSLRQMYDLILYRQFGYGFQLYGSEVSYEQNYDIQGIISFDNGKMATIPAGDTATDDMEVGGHSQAQDISVKNSYAWHNTSEGAGLVFGNYGLPVLNGTVENNYLVGAVPLELGAGLPSGTSSIKNNTFIGSWLNHTPGNANLCAALPNNTCYQGSKPTGTNVFVRPNRWEPGRFHVAVYNWSGAASVPVDLSTSGLVKGDEFEIFDAQNPFGCSGGAHTCSNPTPVFTGVYNGGSITLPVNQTTALAIDCSAGCAPVQHTPSEFGAFIGRKKVTGNTSVSNISGGGATVSASCPAPAAGDGNAYIYLAGTRYAMAKSGTTATYTFSGLNSNTQYGYQVVCGAAFSGSFTTTSGNNASSTTTLASTPNPSTNGQAVSLTATVSPSNATGNVNFYDGQTSLGSAPINNGSAQLSVSSMGGGSHSLTAQYEGASGFSPSTSQALAHTVSQTASTTAVKSSANPSTPGQSVTFTATVSPSNATGTVTFYDGSTSIGSGTLSGGSASIATSALAAGTHSITARYGGSGSIGSSSSPALSQTVSQSQSTTISVASGSNPSAYGSAVTFKATVSPSSSTGTVTFYDNSKSMGTAPLSGGVATFATSTLTAGSHSITAGYTPSGSAAVTSAALTQTVNKATTSTTLSASPNPSKVGNQVTFTASVSPSSATGTVTLTIDAGTSSARTLQASVSNGSAVFSVSNLSKGRHKVKANYGGDGNFSSSKSTTLTQTVR